MKRFLKFPVKGRYPVAGRSAADGQPGTRGGETDNVRVKVILNFYFKYHDGPLRVKGANSYFFLRHAGLTVVPANGIFTPWNIAAVTHCCSG